MLFNTSYFRYLRKFLLGYLCFSSVYASNEHEIIAVDVEQSKPLTSINILQSVREVPEHLNFKVPHVQEMYTPEKVRTLFVESHELPIVDIQLTFDAGSARDEAIGKGLFGLAHTTARLLNEGSSGRSHPYDIAEKLEALGAQYSIQAYRDMFIVKLRVFSTPKHLQTAIEQLILLLKASAFPQSSVQRLFNNAQVGQKQVSENPTQSMNVRFYRTLYQDHPYAEPSTGTVQSLKRIGSPEVQDFRQKFLVRNNLNIAITGDLNATQAYDIAQLISINLPKGQKPEPLPQATPLSDPKIISMPFDSTQAYIMMGQLAVDRKHPDRFALEVGNEILGGAGFNSLLMKELREKRGLTYSISSQISSLQSQGIWAIQYSTRRDQLIPSLEITYQTLLNFIQQPLSSSSVEETKTTILRRFPQLLNSNANINAQLGAIGFYKLPANYLSEYPTYISSLTAQDIQRVWQNNIVPNKLLTLVAGKSINLQEIHQVFENAQNSSQEKSYESNSTK